MARDKFPFEADRAAIAAFVLGAHDPTDPRINYLGPSSDYITHDLMRMKSCAGGHDGTPLWVAPSDKALYGVLQQGPGIYYDLAIINFALHIMGVPDRVEREVPDSAGAAAVDRMHGPRWSFAGAYITPGEPFLVAGPLAMLAFRASVSQHTSIDLALP